MSARPSSNSARTILIGLAIATLIALLVHIGYGSTSFLWPQDVLHEIWRGPMGDTSANTVVWHVRLTRGLGCLLVGGLLGAVGSAFQALFRNPLAEPYTTGVASGSAVGAVLAFLAGSGAALTKDAAAFAGGLVSLAIVLALAGRRGVANVTVLLLAGVVVGSMMAALLALALLAAGQDTNQLLRWLMGSLSEVNWTDLIILGVVTIAGSAVLILQARSLNALAIGEETARRLGVSTRRLKFVILGVGAAMTAVAVGAAGMIAFLGLVAPHISRSLLGVDWRRSLLGSILSGAALLLVSDILAQRLIPLATAAVGLQAVTDLPVGAVTALIGAPSLLILLRRAQ